MLRTEGQRKNFHNFLLFMYFFWFYVQSINIFKEFQGVIYNFFFNDGGQNKILVACLFFLKLVLLIQIK